MFRKVILYNILVFGLSGIAFAQNASEKPQNKQDLKPLEILSNPNPEYTEEAKEEAKKEKFAGAVYLRVTFLASGEIGEVVFLRETSKKKKLTKYGLVEKAVEAAKNIKFKPATADGKAVTVTKTLYYTFSLY